jgi:hypothetical protein
MNGMKPHMEGRATETSSSGDFFDEWLEVRDWTIRRHRKILLREKDGARDAILDDLRNVVRSHYVSPETMAARIEQLGADKTAELLREHLPTKKGSRSGDLGEILATEFVTRKLAYEVPILRLRWKDGREMALRGDDVVAFRRDEDDRLSFLKGEAKSRARLTPDIVQQAANALDQDHGRPGRHSVLFVAERLREQGADEMAVLLENAVLNSFSSCEVEHLLFTFSGNSPDAHLSNHLEALRSGRRRYAVGLRIDDHCDFIQAIYEGL